MRPAAGGRHVPVVDADGRAVAMVSARDALELEEHEFEEALKQREHIRVICKSSPRGKDGLQQRQ